MIPDLDNLSDGYYWSKTKHLGTWRMLRKSTDRQSWGMPWKDIDRGCKCSWLEIRERYCELVAVKHP